MVVRGGKDQKDLDRNEPGAGVLDVVMEKFEVPSTLTVSFRTVLRFRSSLSKYLGTLYCHAHLTETACLILSCFETWRDERFGVHKVCRIDGEIDEVM